MSVEEKLNQAKGSILKKVLGKPSVMKKWKKKEQLKKLFLK